MSNEYWLIYEKGFSPWISNKPLNSEDCEEVHVIEYTAYEKIKSELNQQTALLEVILEFQRNVFEQLTDQDPINRELKEFFKKLNEANQTNKSNLDQDEI